MYDLKGKTAVITGTNRGIGKTILEKFAENGVDVFACARQTNESFEENITSLRSFYSVNIIPVYFDLSSSDEIKNGIKEIVRSGHKIDILVNCAGIADSGTVNTTSIKRLNEVFQINYFAQIQIIQYISRVMIKQKTGGTIINLASIGGIEANPGYLSYGSSKAAIIWATRAISKELGQFNIRVNAVAPGMTKTDMGGAYKSETEMKELILRTGLRRLGEPNEIAEAVLFLASDKASFINGEILQVDGGRV